MTLGFSCVVATLLLFSTAAHAVHYFVEDGVYIAKDDSLDHLIDTTEYLMVNFSKLRCGHASALLSVQLAFVAFVSLAHQPLMKLTLHLYLCHPRPVQAGDPRSAALAPEFGKAAQQLADIKDLHCARVDISENRELKYEFNIQSTPTLIWIKNGQRREFTGGHTTAEIVRFIRKKVGPASTNLQSLEAAENFFNVCMHCTLHIFFVCFSPTICLPIRSSTNSLITLFCM
jgi:hypothetical protein